MRVYKYGAWPPSENAERVQQVLLLAHRYRNTLVEVERARRAAYQELTADVEDKAERKRLGQEIDLRSRALAKSLRGANGLSNAWGSYLLVEQAVDAARSSRDEPRFRRWEGTGRVGVQLQGGLAVVDAMAGTNTKLRIGRIADASGMTAGSRRSGRRAVVRLRVDSAGRLPVWATWNVVLHRPLPDAGVIKWAWMQRVKVGPDYRWHFCVIVDEAACAIRPDVEQDRAGTVAVDLGWRMRPDGMRVGYWRDDDGRHDELVLPESVLTDLDHIRSVGAVRDRLANEFRDQLVAWRAANEVLLPEWFRVATETLAQWRSASRLFALVWRWKRNRFAGDADVFDRVSAPGEESGDGQRTSCQDHCTQHVDCWRREDHHLARWIAHGTANILARRDEHYKRWSAIFARHYARIVIEKFDLRQVAGRRGLDAKSTDAEKVKADRSSSRRHVGAPGTFRLWLLNGCRSRGTIVEAVDAAWTTIDCATCGARIPWDPAVAIDHRCDACGDTWDQDDQACVNLLGRASSDVTSGMPTPLAGGKSARQQRFRMKRGAVEGTHSAIEVDRSQTVEQLSRSTDDSSLTVGSPAQGEEF